MNNSKKKYSPPSSKKESKVYGVHAVKAVFKNRPQDIIKLILTKERAAAFSELLSYMAKHKKAYHLESSDTISQYANSLHHEGVCLLTKDAPPLKLKDVFNHLKNNKPILLLHLKILITPIT